MNPNERTGSLTAIPFRWQKQDFSLSWLWHPQESIGCELRSLYADILYQPLPEHIGELVSSLVRIENKGQKQS